MTENAWYCVALMATLLNMANLRFGHALRAVLRRREPETIEQAWARGLAKRDAHDHAQSHALGSPRKTVISMYTALALLLYVALWCLEDRWYGYLGGLYFAFGVVVASRLDLTRGEHWPRLSLLSRTLCRVVHAWIWPVHAWRSAVAARR